MYTEAYNDSYYHPGPPHLSTHLVIVLWIYYTAYNTYKENLLGGWGGGAKYTGF